MRAATLVCSPSRTVACEFCPSYLASVHDIGNHRRYGPAFASYFQSQNAAGKGEKINLVALGINNGWLDSIYGYKAQIDFLHNNSWRNITSSSQNSQLLSAYNSDCLPALQQCQSTNSNNDCVNALDTCENEVEGPAENTGDFNAYDVRQPSDSSDPPETYVSYLQSSTIQNKIGAKQKYQE